MVPPFYEIFKIEVKIRDLKDLNMLMINQDSSTYCCIPRQYKDMVKYEAKLDEYEEELVNETMKPFTPCGHAFVVIDSIQSAEVIADKFQNKPKSYYNHL